MDVGSGGGVVTGVVAGVSVEAGVRARIDVGAGALQVGTVFKFGFCKLGWSSFRVVKWGCVGRGAQLGV
jgi:hypothetical protein